MAAVSVRESGKGEQSIASVITCGYPSAIAGGWISYIVFVIAGGEWLCCDETIY